MILPIKFKFNSIQFRQCTLIWCWFSQLCHKTNIHVKSHGLFCILFFGLYLIVFSVVYTVCLRVSAKTRSIALMDFMVWQVWLAFYLRKPTRNSICVRTAQCHRNQTMRYILSLAKPLRGSQKTFKIQSSLFISFINNSCALALSLSFLLHFNT